jgi:hypothetical protein
MDRPVELAPVRVRPTDRLTTTTTTIGATDMRRIIATLVAGAAVCGAIAGPSTVTDAQAKRACLEDEPCWNWNAMGNGARGVIVNRRTVVVDHRRFCALVRQDAIDWKRTPHLKGDGPCIRRVRRTRVRRRDLSLSERTFARHDAGSGEPHLAPALWSVWGFCAAAFVRSGLRGRFPCKLAVFPLRTPRENQPVLPSSRSLPCWSTCCSIERSRAGPCGL